MVDTDVKTNRLDSIVNRAYEDLNRFYKNHGESKQGIDRLEKLDKQHKEKAYISELMYFENPIPKEEAPVKKISPEVKKIEPEVTDVPELKEEDFEVTAVPEVKKEEPKKEEPKKEEPGVLYPEQTLRAMTAKDILDLVKTKKGVTLNFSIKSKGVIVRHAYNLLNDKNPTPKKVIVSSDQNVKYPEQVLRAMTAKDILDLVKTEKGVTLNFSIKSKGVIVRHAYNLLNDKNVAPKKVAPKKITSKEVTVSSEPKVFDLGAMKTREIIKYVEEKTGVLIQINLKSKKRVIKHAERILSEKKAA
jgi:hypothetical protein